MSETSRHWKKRAGPVQMPCWRTAITPITGGARPVRDIVGEILAEYDASIAAEGMVLVPKPTLESLSWRYDASHMIYFCPWCQQTGSAEPAVHSPDCGLAAMIAAASQGEGG